MQVGELTWVQRTRTGWSEADDHSPIAESKQSGGDDMIIIGDKVHERNPPGGRTFLVKRSEWYFIATVCYGMHNPWWVPRNHVKELEPIEMQDNDEWLEIK